MQLLFSGLLILLFILKYIILNSELTIIQKKLKNAFTISGVYHFFVLLHLIVILFYSLDFSCGTREYLKNHTLWGMYPYTQRCQINEYIISLTVHRNEREQLSADAAKQQALVAASTQAQRRC